MEEVSHNRWEAGAFQELHSDPIIEYADGALCCPRALYEMGKCRWPLEEAFVWVFSVTWWTLQALDGSQDGLKTPNVVIEGWDWGLPSLKPKKITLLFQY